MIKLLIGLGNPTKTYASTYHNLGRFIVEKLRNEAPLRTFIPSTYMNVSGEAVKKELKCLKLRVGEILVAHDDSDLEFGTVRFYFDGSSAGHKGVESVARTMKNNRFWRMRIGSRTNHSRLKIENSKFRLKAGDFALKKMKKSEIGMLEKNMDVIKENLERFLRKPGRFTFHLT